MSYPHIGEQARHVAAKYNLQQGECAYFCVKCNWDRKIDGVPANQCPNCGRGGLSFVREITPGVSFTPVQR